MPLRKVEYYYQYAYDHASGRDTEIAKTHPPLMQPLRKAINTDFIIDIHELSHGFVAAHLTGGQHTERLYFRMTLEEAIKLLGE